MYLNSNFDRLITVVNAELEILADWFKASRLSLNIKKTNYMLFGHKKPPPDSVFSSNFCLKIDNQSISAVNETKFLGVVIDQKLTWSNHINYISAKVSKSLFILNRLVNKFNMKSLLSIYYSLVYPHLNYCNLIWGNASKSLIHDLFLLQKRAIRIVSRASYRCHTDILF